MKKLSKLTKPFSSTVIIRFPFLLKNPDAKFLVRETVGERLKVLSIIQRAYKPVTPMQKNAKMKARRVDVGTCLTICITHKNLVK